MEFSQWGWNWIVRITVFALVGIWVFSLLLWDFILSVVKQYEFMRRDESSIFTLKSEVQCFVGACAFIGLALYFLYTWFQEPGLGDWLVGGVVLAGAVWLNRIVEKRWRFVDWK